jgi:hypothetical protein
MPTTTIADRKGGVGKRAVVRHLAYHADDAPLSFANRVGAALIGVAPAFAERMIAWLQRERVMRDPATSLDAAARMTSGTILSVSVARPCCPAGCGSAWGGPAAPT